jgi:ribosomal protein S18 acetylase RimI-like enzyme
MQVEPARPADLADVRAAYEHARVTQRAAGSDVWPDFPDAAILAEIGAGFLFRIVLDGATVGVFSMTSADPAIWGPHERAGHLYLHRIARAAHYPGRGLIDVVLAWADKECGRREREGLRMDTWARNTALIDFYVRRGFRIIEERRLGVDPRLPPHYHNNSFTLLERSCGA